MNRELAQSIIASFRLRSSAEIDLELGRFRERDWMRTRRWLHTGGLALYLWSRLTRLGIADVMPSQLGRELTIQGAENCVRTADLFSEFARINSDFQRSGILYANLKGFTLAPAAYSEPALRYQHDLDFLVARRDSERCRQVLARYGYVQTAVWRDTWEFCTAAGEVSSMRSLYRIRQQRSVELHFVSEEENNDGRLARLQLQTWNGFEFPALSECDKLLAQAMHLFKHFQTEWTRTAWLLEYAQAIRAHASNESLWREVDVGLQRTPEIRTGVGMTSLVASRNYGLKLPDVLAGAVDAMQPRLRLWIDQYEPDLVFAERPGSKLYLLLNDVLFESSPEWRRERSRRLLPRKLPPRVVVKSDSAWLNLRMRVERLRFVAMRLCFHVAAGVRYQMEAARWRRFIARAQ